MATISPNSNTQAEILETDGYLEIDHESVNNTLSISGLWKETKSEFIDFLHWIMLERTGVAPTNYKDEKSLFENVVEKSFQETERIFGDPRALSLVPTNENNRAKKPFGQHVLLASASGMGWGSSYFEGKSHVRLQAEVTKALFDPLYSVRGEKGDTRAIGKAEEHVGKAIDKVEGLENVGSWWRQWLEAKQPVPPDKKIPAKSRVVWQAIKSIRTALETRTKRIQGQLPENSCLCFLSNECNTRLYLLMCRPKSGVPSMRVSLESWTKSRPFPIPHLSDSNATEKVNLACRAVREAFDKPSEASGEVADWVRDNRSLLETQASILGLESPFRPSTKCCPRPKDGDVLLWQGPHWTEGGDDKFKYAAFIDAVPRAFFDEQVWAFLWECNKVCVVDLGAGSYRDSFMSWHFAKSRRQQSSAVLDLPEELRHYFGAPLVDQAATCCVVPERFRIKRRAKWGMIHIDRSPLPWALEKDLSSKKRKLTDS